MNKTIIFVKSSYDRSEAEKVREEIQAALMECNTPVVVLPQVCTIEVVNVEVADTCEPECQDACDSKCDSKCEPISQILSAADIENGAVVSTEGLGVVIIVGAYLSDFGTLWLRVKVVSTGNYTVVPAAKCFRYTLPKV